MPMKPSAIASNDVRLYPIRWSIMPVGMPMNMFAKKLVMLPIMPSVFEPAMPGCCIHTLPSGAARFNAIALMP